MKNLIYLLLITLSTSALAEDCSVYQLNGTVKDFKHSLHMIIAERKGSEMDLIVPIKIQTEFSPYVNKFVAGTFTIYEKVVQPGANEE